MTTLLRSTEVTWSDPREEEPSSRAAEQPARGRSAFLSGREGTQPGAHGFSAILKALHAASVI